MPSEPNRSLAGCITNIPSRWPARDLNCCGPQRFAPVIFEAPKKVAPGGSYEISGILFNGVTQGAAYGDDVQAATNFPLVRITNLKTRHVFYARTHHHSSMAVASDQVVSTHFNVSGAQEPGPSKLEVVANGVASAPVVVHVQ